MITASSYFKGMFGHKMYKASISLNGTCPNRDGSRGVGGCIFCSEGGSGEFAASGYSVTNQICQAIDQVRRKAGDNAGYIAYFQSFTNTYCEPEYLAKVLSEADILVLCKIYAAREDDIYNISSANILELVEKIIEA